MATKLVTDTAALSESATATETVVRGAQAGVSTKLTLASAVIDFLQNCANRVICTNAGGGSTSYAITPNSVVNGRSF